MAGGRDLKGITVSIGGDITKVFCGECGAPMTRRTVNDPGGVKIKTWICREKRKGSGCKGRNVKEEELLAVSETATKIVVKEDGIEVE